MEHRSELIRAVARGIDFIDRRIGERFPDWRDDVDWSIVDTDSYESDVIAQLFGYGMRERAGKLIPYTDHLPGRREDHINDWEIYHGFQAQFEEDTPELNRLWREMGRNVSP